MRTSSPAPPRGAVSFSTMTYSLFFTILAVANPAATYSSATGAVELPLASTAALFLQDGPKAKIKAAGEDLRELEALAAAWTESGAEEAAREAWARILEIDASHERAHVGLRHHRYGDSWYSTYAELAKARREEAKRRFDEEGVVPFGDAWVKPANLPFLRMGWESSKDGGWSPPGSLERAKDESEKLAAGWQKQHSTWIEPSDFPQWRKGLWKVGDDWLTIAKANEAHAEIGAWWEIPGDHFVALTTLPEEQGKWIHWWADQAAVDLEKIFGLSAKGAPGGLPELVVVDSIAQYNEFAAGSVAKGLVPADASGHSSLHYAFFTDGWTEVAGGVARFRGTGAAYYDVDDPALAPFGQHAIRHAAALAWLEAVDPSWDAVSLMLTGPAGAFPDLSFWEEKRIPRWMRYGAAAYCERFFEDTQVGDGGDPLWARKWARENLATGGPMDPIEDVLALQFDTAAPVESLRLIHEAGLVMLYVLSGKDKKVTSAWSEYKAALVGGGDVAPSLELLERAIAKAEGKIASF